eukprot:SAG11_NODE_2640_length_3140_cov_2.031897_1_plen_809_part_10
MFAAPRVALRIALASALVAGAQSQRVTCSGDQMCPGSYACPPSGVCPCPIAYLSDRLNDVNEVCCNDDYPCDTYNQRLVPDTCSTSDVPGCAFAYTQLWEACGDTMQNLPGASQLSTFNDQCAGELAEDTCADDTDWRVGGCVDAYESSGYGSCADLLTSGYTCDATFAPGEQYAGYCDCACGYSGTCSSLALGGVDQCECDHNGGISNCPTSCDGFCTASDAQQIVPSGGGGRMVHDLGELVHSSIDVGGDCPTNKGRHKWFFFSAEVGHMYRIFTRLPAAGGLTSTYIHLHSLDQDQTAIADSASWNCETDTAEPADSLPYNRASCMMWACTSTGTYGVRVQRRGGLGAFSVGIEDTNTIAQVAAAAGMRIDYQGKTIRSGDAPFPTPHLSMACAADGTCPEGSTCVDGACDLTSTIHGHWQSDFTTSCQLVYCHFQKIDAISGDATDLVSDGESFNMNIQGVQGVTYNFTLALGEHSDAMYFKLTFVPVGVEGGTNTYESNDKMQKRIELGPWGDTAAGDHTYAQYAPDYDIKEYKSFPGRDGPSTDYFAWVAPASGDYYLTITANCDEQIMDDVEANFPPAAHPGAIGCNSAWSVDLAISDQAVALVLPLITFAPIGANDPTSPGSPAQLTADTHIENTDLPVVVFPQQVMPLPHVILSTDPPPPPPPPGHPPPLPGLEPLPAAPGSNLPTVTVIEDTVCAMPIDPMFQEVCAASVLMFLGAPPNRHRRLQHNHHNVQPTISHVEVRSSNPEQTMDIYHRMQAQACMESGIVGEEGGPCAPHAGHHNGGRRLSEEVAIGEISAER